MNGLAIKKALAVFLQTGTSCDFWMSGQWESKLREPNYPGMVREKASLYEKTKLPDQLRPAQRARHYSPQTGEAYALGVKRYIFFLDVRHPSEMAPHRRVTGPKSSETSGLSFRSDKTNRGLQDRLLDYPSSLLRPTRLARLLQTPISYPDKSARIHFCPDPDKHYWRGQH